MKKKYSRSIAFLVSVGLVLSLASATDLQNIESITPQGSQVINITGETIIGPFDQNHLEFQSGNANWGWRLETEDQGSGTVPFTLEKKSSGSYSNVLKATQNGNLLISAGYLDLKSNKITGISNLEGSNIVNAGNINSGAVSTTELNTGDVDDRYLNRGSSDSMLGSIEMNNNDITGINRLSIQDPGSGEGISFGDQAEIYSAPLDDSNSGGYLQLVNDGGIAFEPSTDGTTAAEFTTGNNLKLNGNNVNNVNKVQFNGDSGTNVYRIGESGLESNAFTMEASNRDIYLYSASTTSGDNIHLTTQDGGGNALDRLEAGTGSSTVDLDVRNARLDLNNNNINSVSTINNGGSTVNTGGTISVGSGSVTASQRMCIGDRCT